MFIFCLFLFFFSFNKFSVKLHARFYDPPPIDLLPIHTKKWTKKKTRFVDNDGACLFWFLSLGWNWYLECVALDVLVR